uniref:two-component response regulator EHD1-like n=1 Tax=Fragaria vesca subsp. vesca TaxID=101020 RepID=UPI0005C84037|nr:PREDICTED: two-component response regulator EHD1-like [Fragaria vesca subsp. vesca]
MLVLSASEDTQLVMKGISNGACDYLLKPVRVEQLKLIWQHVFRIRRRTENNVDLKENISVAAACYCCASPISLSTKRRRMQNNTDLLKSSSSTLLKQNTDRLVRFMKMSRQKLQADINNAEAVADPITVLATEKMRAIQNRRLFSKAYADAMAARASHSSPHLPMVDDLSLRNEELNRQNRRLQFLQDQCRLYRSGSLSQYKPHIEPIDD